MVNMIKLLSRFFQWIDDVLVNFFYDPLETSVENLPMNKPVETKAEDSTTNPKEASNGMFGPFLWTPPTAARHSVRVICDEEGLTLEQKNTLCATVGGESGWTPTAIGPQNYDGTRDYGICQINEKFWIGQNKTFPSKEYVLSNPEACIRWMCKEWKAGNRNWWIAYKSGAYKRFL